MTPLRFELPRPPSVNNLFFTANDGRRRLASHYIHWRSEAVKLVMVQRMGQPWPLKGPYLLAITATRDGWPRKRPDLGNLEKGVSDVLVHMGIIEDDSLAEKIVLEWGDVAGCVVMVTPFGEESDGRVLRRDAVDSEDRERVVAVGGPRHVK